MPLHFHYKPKLVTMAAKLDPSLHFGDEMINVVGYKVLKSWPFLEKKYRIEIMHAFIAASKFVRFHFLMKLTMVYK